VSAAQSNSIAYHKRPVQAAFCFERGETTMSEQPKIRQVTRGRYVTLLLKWMICFMLAWVCAILGGGLLVLQLYDAALGFAVACHAPIQAELPLEMSWRGHSSFWSFWWAAHWLLRAENSLSERCRECLSLRSPLKTAAFCLPPNPSCVPGCLDRKASRPNCCALRRAGMTCHPRTSCCAPPNRRTDLTFRDKRAHYSGTLLLGGAKETLQGNTFRA